MLIILLWLKNTDTNSKASKFNLNDRVRITNYKNVFSNSYAENWSREIFIFVSVLKTNKVRVVSDFPNQAAKKKIEHATGIDASHLAARKYLIALKAEVHKLDINELTNVPTSLNDLKAKVEDLDVGKLKNVPVDLNK